MQNCIGDRDDTFRTQVTRGRSKEGEQFGGSTAFVLVWLQCGMLFRLPRRPWLRDGLVGSGLILTKLYDPSGFPLLVGLLN
jgi:hypothetical protein